ncbi:MULTISPECIES: SusC/RagA family TonB-linked outer membrane protein [unclassified Tenacibaculum]|uniref:SusC/RagA family TonB-linked outer membrane protein n=1 Tax=unclassified Tenacibaculum TaxID=2635139 RepID=UPI001F467A69|nr:MULTISPECIES: SusC/RagA family TonB-linked outer membrane protein [unclassified Tenacibaculum]MCF2875378.1 SusC/RagA family TonB-linked outer membrane protein [Tenacibaculum sp. Cn5-1]MCF2935454.1 SusC/RagA family TonB-linked outer membrane protein [Tenacibaculum sp. Cn5-34]MCG7512014.1 SusC/RagA family TonB-linked outer membrane protein [Tenacibaculum sp. Cn5-46]
MFFCAIVSATAQQKTITGTVSDSSGELPGVSILIKGTVKGTETDLDGKYTIKANTGDILQFMFLGYVTAEKIVGESSVVDVTLQEDSGVLDEVVVVGYGKSTKQSFTGSVKVVKAEELEKKSVANISQALAGEVAGVNVINTSGQPGTVATIRIRGFGSVNGNRSPLYVVDGVPFSGSINSINPSDIASTTVLKDATATAIYGSRGANGVIVLTTKAGKSGRTSMEVDIKTGVNFQLLPRYDVIKSPDEYIELSWHAMGNRTLDFNPANNAEAYANTYLFSSRGIDPKFNFYNTNDVSQIIDPTTGKVRPNVSRRYTPENWADYGFQTAIRTEANLKMSGGNENTKYFSSFGYLDDKGYLINSGYKRYASRLNITHKPKEWLTANANVGYTLGKTIANGQSEDSGSIFWFVDNIPSIYPLFLRDANGNLVPDTKYGGNQYDYGIDRGFGGLTNAIGGANYDFIGNDRHSLNGNFSFKVDLLEGLVFEAQYGAQYYSRVANTVRNPFYGSAESQDGSLFKTTSSALTQNFLKIFRYNKSFGDHNLSALLAHETNQREFNTTSISKNKVVNLLNGLTDANNYVGNSSPPTGYTTKTALESYFGQVNYNYQNKYYLTGSLRRDGSSRFANNKWGTFGSLGASWIVSKEAFMFDATYINFLKLKASYGILGDQAGVDIYSGQNTYAIGNLGGEIALTPRAIQNPDLTWETSKMFQVGLEFAILGSKLEGSVDYYIKNTDDLIFERRIAPSTGNAILDVNDGSLKNSGLEFDLTAHLIDKENYKFNVSLNGEMFNNELTAMPIEPATGQPKLLDIAGLYGRSKGHSIYDFYMREWAGVDQANGDPLWNQYYHDANNNNVLDAGEGIRSLTEYRAANPNNAISKTTTNVYSDATQKYVGKSAIPKIRGAFKLNAQIYDFTISSQFGYSLGGYSYDSVYAGLMSNDQIGSGNWHTDIRNSWKNPGDVTNVPKLISNRNTQVNSASTRFITSSDYLALNNLRIGYAVPSKFIESSGISSLNLWMSGDNLFLLSARDGFNPATSETGRSNVYRYSPLSTISFGARIKF